MRFLVIILFAIVTITLYGQDSNASLSSQSTTEILQKPPSAQRYNDFNQDMIAAKINRRDVAETSGTNTYTASVYGVGSYSNDIFIIVRIKNPSSAPSTLNVNTIGAKKIYKNPTTQAGNGDLVDEQAYIFAYDTGLDTGAGGWLMVGSGGGGGSVGTITTRNNLPPEDHTTDFTLVAADTSVMHTLSNTSGALIISLSDMSAVDRGLQFAFWREAGTDTVYFDANGETLESYYLGITEKTFMYLYYNPDKNQFNLSTSPQAQGFENPMTTLGDIIVAASGGSPTRLGIGSGFLKGGATPSWSAVDIASADVTGVLPGANGGTGVANTGKTITVSGNTTIGSSTNTVTLATAGNTNVTLPTTGTLATLAGAESLTNKKLGSLTSNGLIKTSGGDGTLSIASAGSDYELPLTFSTGLTRSTNTITVNTSQNISTLSNLTSNGLVTTSGGTGALSITVPGSGILLWLATPSSANLRSAMTDEEGTGLLMFNPMTAAGDMMYGGTSGALTRLATGSGFLKGGTTPSWSAVNLASADVSGDLPFSNLAQGSARSVLGVSGNATDDVASIQSSAGGQSLQSTGTSIGWAEITRWVAFKNTNIGTSVTGTTTETKMFSQLVAGNTFDSNDILRWAIEASKSGGGGTITLRMYVNDTDDLVTPTLWGTYTGVNSTTGQKMSREIAFTGSISAQRYFSGSSSQATDFTTSASVPDTSAIDFSTSQYFIITIQNTSTSDTSVLRTTYVEVID